MATLLHVDVSIRGNDSVSRRLSAAFVEQWKQKHPDGKVVERDLMKTDLPFIDMPWVNAAYVTPDQHTPEQKEALRISDHLSDELLAVDEIVIGTPMYNFAVPAALKAWIDLVIRHGKTFTIGANGYQGLATGKKATFIIASGGDYASGAPAEKYNQETPYLKGIFGFIGITDIEVVQAGGTTAVAQGKVPMDEFVKPYVEKVQAVVA